MYVPQIVLKDHPHMTSDGLEYKDLLQSLMKFLLSVITIFFYHNLTFGFGWRDILPSSEKIFTGIAI